MIEKVARAIRASKIPDTMAGTFDNMSEEGKELYYCFAKAAIAAMREPTEEMELNANCEAILSNNDVDVIACYQLMIDAALKE